MLLHVKYLVNSQIPLPVSSVHTYHFVSNFRAETRAPLSAIVNSMEIYLIEKPASLNSCQVKNSRLKIVCELVYITFAVDPGLGTIAFRIIGVSNTEMIVDANVAGETKK